MEQKILYFTANEQELTLCGSTYYASDTINYIGAVFDLGDNWSGFDSVRAVWFNDFNTISTVLDSNGTCTVPMEVLKRKGKVFVNLVGSIAENDVITDRLTTRPVNPIIIDAKARITGSETGEITASQFEQFAANVHSDAVSAANSASAASGYADDAEASAELAEQASANAGYMFFHIDENGHLIYERTSNTQVDFYLSNGHLYVEAIA